MTLELSKACVPGLGGEAPAAPLCPPGGSKARPRPPQWKIVGGMDPFYIHCGILAQEGLLPLTQE